jgi:hypothetical protein
VATVTIDSRGKRQIQFQDGNRKRHTIYLGDMTAKQAAEVCTRVGQLNSACIAGVAPHENTAGWLRDLPPALYDKLAKHGLCAGRDADKVVTLGVFLRGCLADKSHAADGTKKKALSTFNCNGFGDGSWRSVDWVIGSRDGDADVR